MYRFTIFRNTEPSVLYFDFDKRTKDVELVSKVFNGDASIHEMKHMQVMTPELRERIPLFDAIGDKAYSIKKYFEEISDGQKFFVVIGNFACTFFGKGKWTFFRKVKCTS